MKRKIWTICVLLCLFLSLECCSGVSGNPITNDVSRLLLLKQNIPKNYEIPIHYIPKELCGMCWVILNSYPLEQSLKDLAQMFGAISSNKDEIIIFITMLQSLRLQLDHEELEATMQVFQCHYREEEWLSGQYFDYVRELLDSAAHMAREFRCKPPPCPASYIHLPGREAQDHGLTRSRNSLLSLLLLPATASVFLLVCVVKLRRGQQRNIGNRTLSSEVEGSQQTIHFSILPQPFSTNPSLHPFTSPTQPLGRV
ncbi:uncharacterized protein LOC124466080 isoform X1 [Hypomesus transpacificus]|uniref:uncharacterized protein LOC124466080 isoform X1 n=2 Tax=Hypomesus transpacificus TaxID=137520 RepID=UPI001F07B47D|nr:uncharacterized protein LOC124466080 isoform X1 [Hypomesus transpacificus]